MKKEYKILLFESLSNTKTNIFDFSKILFVILLLSGGYTFSQDCNDRFSVPDCWGTYRDVNRNGQGFDLNKPYILWAPAGGMQLCMIEFDACTSYTTYKSVCIQKDVYAAWSVGSYNMPYEEMNYTTIGLSDIDAARINWIICNYPTVTSDVQEAIWYFTRGIAGASTTQGSYNYIAQYAVQNAVNDGRQGDLTFYYRANDQNLLKWECSDVQLGRIIGRVSLDTDNNGTGETNVVGAVVTLRNDSDNSTTIATTDSNGYYVFNNVPAGNYTVIYNEPADYASISDFDGSTSSTDTDGDDSALGANNQIPVVLAAGETDSENDFIDVQLSKISGRVLADTTGDGNGNIGISGVRLNLKNAAGVVVKTTTTTADGTYEFTGVVPGEYTVVEEQPVAYLNGSDSQSSDNDTTSNTSTTDDIIPVTVVPGEEDINNNFIEKAVGSISGKVLNDINRNGVIDTNDAPIEGVTLVLKDSNGDQVLDANGDNLTAVTDANGNYTFPVVPIGVNYWVVEQQPNGYYSLSDTEGNQLDNLIQGIDVVSGQDNSNNDFLETQGVAISGNLYADHDALIDNTVDGVGFNAPGANDMFAVLVDENDVVVKSVPINLNGTYSFTDVEPNKTYKVLIATTNQVVGNVTPTPSVTSGWNFTGENIGATAGNDGTPNGTIEVVVANANILDVNFGIIKYGMIDGYVLNDVNNNGVLDENLGNDGIPGVTLGLFEADGVTPVNNELGNPITTTTLTSATFIDGKPKFSGYYRFDGLLPGSYVVKEIDLAGYTSVLDQDSNTGEFQLDNDINTDGNNNALSVELGIYDNSIASQYNAIESDSENDFLDVQIGIISGKVSVDTTGDSNGNEGLGGVTISVLKSDGTVALDTNGDPLTTTTISTPTDLDGDSVLEPVGSYYFGNVPSGEYTIVETQPSGYSDVSDVQSVDNDTTSNTDTNDNIIPVTVIPGETDKDNDFIEVQKSRITISGTVYYDTDRLIDNRVDGLLLIPSGIKALLIEKGSDGSEKVVAIDNVPGLGESGVGTYSFDGLSDTNYYVMLTKDDVLVGSQAPTSSSLPNSYVNTGEQVKDVNLGGAEEGDDGLVDGKSRLFTTSSTDVVGVDFGIIRTVLIVED